MTPSMPIPTDNFYKFAALFGLAILISFMVLSIYLPEKFGEPAFKESLEFEILKSRDSLSTEETIRKNHLETKIKLFDSFARQIVYGSAIIGMFGGFLFLWGIIVWWWKVQPKQDELLNLQIEKTKREIQVLEKQLNPKRLEMFTDN
jgi:hypothetical protein